MTDKRLQQQHCTAPTNTTCKKWFQIQANVDVLDVRPPTRFASAPDMLQVIVTLPMSSWVQILRASGIDGVVVRPFVETDQKKLIYRAVPLPARTTLASGIRQAQFLRENAFGVVTYAAGFGIRLKSKDFNNIFLQVC